MVCHNLIQIYFLSALSLSTNPAIRCPWERKSWQCICRGGGEKWLGDEWVGGSAPESVPDPSLKRREWLKKGNVAATNVQDWLEKGEMITGGERDRRSKPRTAGQSEVDGAVIWIYDLTPQLHPNWPFQLKAKRMEVSWWLLFIRHPKWLKNIYLPVDKKYLSTFCR